MDAEKSRAFALETSYYLFLQRRMYEIFTYVSCNKNNFKTYSIQNESLLLDVCSFFDSLKQNLSNERSKNYEELFNELNLSTKEVKINSYEGNFQDGYTLTPFKNWVGKQPAPWWDAFTSLKHDRLSNFKKATLGNVINALAACFILLLERHEEQCKKRQIPEMEKLFLPKYWILNDGGYIPVMTTYK